MAERIAALIPLYNHAEYIGEALESVLAQTRPADRIIVIDDGSPDGSLDAAKKFESRGVEVHGRENRGAHATWHELVEKADDCEICALLNSDDAWHPERLEVCLDALRSQPEKRVVATALEMFDEKSQPIAKDHPRLHWMKAVWSLKDRADLDLAGWLGMANFILTTTNVVARRQALLDSPFQPYHFNHDYYFLSQSAIRGELALVPDEVTVKYRVHSTNTISAGPGPIIREMLRLHVDLHREFGEKGFRDQAERKRFESYMRAAWDSVSSHHAGLFHDFCARALAGVSEEEIDTLLKQLPQEELETFPNRSLVNSFEDGGVLGGQASGALGERFEEAHRARAASQKKAKDLDQLARLRQTLLRSRWLALGRAFGAGKALTGNNGADAEEKLARLEKAVRCSGWLRFGANLGSKASKAALERADQRSS